VDARSTFLNRLHEFVQHSGDLPAFLVESGVYFPLTDWEQLHWQQEINQKNLLFNTNPSESLD
jgi:hypothetical protein